MLKLRVAIHLLHMYMRACTPVECRLIRFLVPNEKLNKLAKYDFGVNLPKVSPAKVSLHTVHGKV